MSWGSRLETCHPHLPCMKNVAQGHTADIEDQAETSSVNSRFFRHLERICIRSAVAIVGPQEAHMQICDSCQLAVRSLSLQHWQPIAMAAQGAGLNLVALNSHSHKHCRPDNASLAKGALRGFPVFEESYATKLEGWAGSLSLGSPGDNRIGSLCIQLLTAEGAGNSARRNPAVITSQPAIWPCTKCLQVSEVKDLAVVLSPLSSGKEASTSAREDTTVDAHGAQIGKGA